MDEFGRRDLMRGVLLLAGVAATSGMMAGSVFAGPASLPGPTMSLLTAVADTIIPPTDTPGAAGAGVPQKLDKLLANWASPLRRAQILGALKAIDEKSVAATGTPFVALTPVRRFEVLSVVDKAMVVDPGYASFRQLVATCYYLSEVGATVELRYEHAPGAWEPSLRVTAETRNYGGPDHI